MTRPFGAAASLRIVALLSLSALWSTVARGNGAFETYGASLRARDNLMRGPTECRW